MLICLHIFTSEPHFRGSITLQLLLVLVRKALGLRMHLVFKHSILIYEIFIKRYYIMLI